MKAHQEKDKRIVNLRSAVSHGGRTSVLRQDVHDLEQIVGKLTMVLIDRAESIHEQKRFARLGRKPEASLIDLP